MNPLTPDAIADAVRATRYEFRDLFLRAQAAAGVPMDKRLDFEGVAAAVAASDDKAVLREAARVAGAGGWGDALVDELIDSNRENGSLRAYRVGNELGVHVLQAITDAGRGMAHPDAVVRGLTNGMRWTCRVIVNGQPKGTGVLVQPHLVLTAWHVVQDLFRLTNDQWQPDPAVNPPLRVEFDDLLLQRRGGVVAQPPLVVPAHPTRDWCPQFRSCHVAEHSNDLPPDLAELNGYWDFAYIRLAVPVGLTRGYAASNALVPVPRAGQPVFVFQHPGGGPQRYDMGKVYDPPARLRAAVPHFRFLHEANAIAGSSGGPCYDRDFFLCGLHQGTWAGVANGKNVNRGVPLARICEYIRQQPGGLPPLDPAENTVAGLGPAGETPVVGCDGFQADLWAVALSGRRPLLVVVGESRAGKSFRLRLADDLLPTANHLKVRIDAPTAVPRPAVEFADHVCRQAGTVLPPVGTPAEANTTPAAWLKDQVAAKLMGALDAARGGRVVWLLLADLNKAATYGEGTSDLLYLLYERVRDTDWLRVVLDGMTGDLPQALRPLTVPHTVPAIKRSDILDCLERRLSAPGGEPVDREKLGLVTGVLYRGYQQADRAVAVERLGLEITEVIQDNQRQI